MVRTACGCAEGRAGAVRGGRQGQGTAFIGGVAEGDEGCWECRSIMLVRNDFWNGLETADEDISFADLA